MDFSQSEELLEIKRIVREFAEKEIRPHRMEWDERQVFPMEVLKKLGELGFMGVLIPHEYGGAGLGYMNYAALDGSRPAIYYVNLKDNGAWPKYTLASLSMHEAIPGHAW